MESSYILKHILYRVIRGGRRVSSPKAPFLCSFIDLKCPLPFLYR